MTFKFANEVIDEIKERGAVETPVGSVSDEEFEQWLRTDSCKKAKWVIVVGREPIEVNGVVTGTRRTEKDMCSKCHYSGIGLREKYYCPNCNSFMMDNICMPEDK